MECREFPRAINLLLAAAGPFLLAGCDHATVEINGEQGKPLAELDQSGPPPHKLVLLGPDRVEITHGDKLAISVSGDQADDADEQKSQDVFRISKSRSVGRAKHEGERNFPRASGAKKKPRSRMARGFRGGSYRCLRVVLTTRLLLKMEISTGECFWIRGRVSQR